MGNRPPIARGGGKANHLSPPRSNLLAASGKRADHYGQQYVHWLAYGRCVARQVAGGNKTRRALRELTYECGRDACQRQPTVRRSEMCRTSRSGMRTEDLESAH